MGPLIRMKSVCYTYPNGTVGVNGVTLSINRGDKIAVIGPNGGGKSTLLMLAAGLIPPSSGKLNIFGVDVNKKTIEKKNLMRPVRKGVGIVFQDPDVQLFSSTVFDDVAFGLLYREDNKEAIEKKVNAILSTLRITHIKDRHPYALSGGEKRKAAIATALVLDPEVILFDEVTADLDPKSRDELTDIIIDLQKKGKTTVVATHDLNTAREIANKVVVLSKRIITVGSVEEVMGDRNLLIKANLLSPRSRVRLS